MTEFTAEQKMVNLISGDGESFTVVAEAAKLSKLVATIYDEEAPEDEVQDIPLPNVTKEVLKKITEFMNHFHADSDENKDRVRNIPKPIMSNEMKDIVPEWYAVFLKIPKQEVADILKAANYMNMTELVQLSCATISSWVKCMNPDQIKEVFGIKDDFTEEEIALVKRERKEWDEKMKEEEEAARNGSSASAAGGNA